MNNGLSNSRDTMTILRGTFFLAVGVILLLNILMPRYFSALFIICAAIGMIVYGGRVLGLHTTLRNLVRKVSKD